MITLDVEQQSAEWIIARLGIPTASCFDRIITTKGEPSKQAEKYLQQLACERVTGISEDSYKSAYMQRGNDVEAEARQFYELVTDSVVQKAGICYPDERKRYSCSPDGLVGEDGGIQIKCPSGAVHVGYLLANKLPTEYFTQIQGELLCTGRKWWDFISYYPGLKPLLIRVNRDESFIATLKSALEAFCKDLDEVIERIRE